jgi:signal transduction histidine kinase/CheY-like chemotaxis protein
MNIISLIDLACFLGLATALAVVWRHRQHSSHAYIRPIILTLLVMSLLHSLISIIEWSGIVSVPDAFEDGFQLLLPTFWGVTFYAVGQKISQQMVEEADRTKSQFLANMSHEIRTPMTAIMGFLDLMRDGDLTPEEHRSHIETIQRNSEHLLTVLDDILDLAKIESGHIDVERGLASPCQIMKDAGRLMKDQAIAKGLAFDVDYQSQIPDRIRTDSVRVRQILMNLLSNAVKFTETGSVRVTVTMVKEEDPSEAQLRFDVTDTGPGLTPTEQESIFQPFTQVDSSSTHKLTGTGLGLAISHRLAELLGGNLAVQSQVGQGSAFSLTIPTGPLEGVEMIDGWCCDPSTCPKPHHARQTVQEGLSGRVLLAEDMPDNRLLVRTLLRKTGLQVEEVENGRLAFETAKNAWDAGEPFDVILMDMQMPEMDGYEATSMLRTEGYNHPIIALTAHAMGRDREKCLAVGCDDFLSKPVDRDALLALLDAHLHKQQA